MYFIKNEVYFRSFSMDNFSVGQFSFKPSFGMIHVIDSGKLSKTRAVVANSITKQLRKVDPNDKLIRTYEMVADAKGYDIFLRNNDRYGGIRMDLVSKKDSKNYFEKQWDIFDRMSFVGIYKSEQDFKQRYLTHVLKRNMDAKKEAKSLLIGFPLTVLAFLGFTIGAISLSNGGCSRQGISDTQLIKSTTKSFKDSTNNIVDTTYKNAKSVIKRIK